MSTSARVTPATHPDIVQLIVEDHQTFRDDFDALSSLRQSDDGTALNAAWQRLALRLETHARAEEDILYPALLKHAPPRAEGETVEALRDHNEIREAAESVGKVEIGSHEWWLAVDACRRANDEHLTDEENVALPSASRSIEMALLTRMGEQWAAYMHDHARPDGPRPLEPEVFVEENSSDSEATRVRDSGRSTGLKES